MDPTARVDADRNRQAGTEACPESRSRRRWYYFGGVLSVLALLTLASPHIVSRSRLGRLLVLRAVAANGLHIDYKSMRIGWNTPLRLRGVQLKCKSDTDRLRIEQIHSDVTFSDLLGWSHQSRVHWVFNGIRIHTTLGNNRFSIEDELTILPAKNDFGNPLQNVHVELHNTYLSVKDGATDDAWQVSKLDTDVQWRPGDLAATFSGTITEPGGSDGQLAGKLTAMSAAADKQWQVDLDGKLFPMSLMTLIQHRFPKAMSNVPPRIIGKVQGSVQVAGHRDGVIDVSVEGCEVNNLAVAHPAIDNRIWHNQQILLDGKLAFSNGHVTGDLLAKSDDVSVKFDGSLAFSRIPSGANDRLTWLSSVIDGTASVEIDLASFQKSFPDVLPLQKDVEIVSGKSTVTIAPVRSLEGEAKQFKLQTEELKTEFGDRAVYIDPINFEAIISLDQDEWETERFDLRSSFVRAVGKGGLRTGSTDFEADLQNLTTFVGLFAETSSDAIGSVKGSCQWGGKRHDQWRLQGSCDASLSQISENGKQVTRLPELTGNLGLAGRWGDQRLEQLSVATMTLAGTDLNVHAELTEAVSNIASDTPLPLTIGASGGLERLASVLSLWIPSETRVMDGQFNANLKGMFTLASGRLTHATINLLHPRVANGHHLFSRNRVGVNFDGQFSWPNIKLVAESLKFTDDVISAEMRGQSADDRTNLDVAWRANLDRLSRHRKDPVADDSSSDLVTQPIRPVVMLARPRLATNNRRLTGVAKGRLTATGDNRNIEITTNALLSDFAVLEILHDRAAEQTTAPILARDLRDKPRERGATPLVVASHPLVRKPTEPHVVWAEPEVEFDAVVRYDRSTRQTKFESVQLTGQWFATKLSGQANWDMAQGDLVLKGATSIGMPELSQRLTGLARAPIRLEGRHQTPVDIRINRTKDDSIAFAMDGRLEWESGEVAGVKLGAASVPIRVTETHVEVAKGTVPVGEGKIHLAGKLQYRRSPAVLRLEPGVIAESIDLTQDMTDGWLKYVAPPVNRVEHIRGRFGAEIDKAAIVIGVPGQSRVVGRLNVDHADMSLTPMTRELVTALKYLQAKSQGKTAPPSKEVGSVSMPKQVIDFDLDLGVVNHKKAVFDFDQTRIASSGDVTLDGKLAVIAEMPMDFVAIGSDTRSEPGRLISIPVTGSIQQSRVDPTGIGSLVTIMATTTRNARQRLRMNSTEHTSSFIERSEEAFHHADMLLEAGDQIAERLKRSLERSRKPRQ